MSSEGTEVTRTVEYVADGQAKWEGHGVSLDIGGPEAVSVTVKKNDWVATQRDVKATHLGGAVRADYSGTSMTAKKGDVGVLIRGGSAPLELKVKHPLEGITPDLLEILPKPALVDLFKGYKKAAPNHGFGNISDANVEAMPDKSLRALLLNLIQQAGKDNA